MDYQAGLEKNSMLITDVEMLNGGERDSGNRDMCNKCNSSRYIPEDGSVIEEANILWVECEKCEKWYHTPCVGLGDKDQSELERIEYVCCNE